MSNILFYQRFFFPFLLIIGFSGCGLDYNQQTTSYNNTAPYNNTKSYNNSRPYNNSMGRRQAPNQQKRRIQTTQKSPGATVMLDPETVKYNHFHLYEATPRQIIQHLKSILQHNNYPNLITDPFTNTLITGTKPHNSLFVKMARGDIRSRVAAKTTAKKQKTELALYICVEQKLPNGQWKIIKIPSQELDFIDSANYETYFSTLQWSLKPKTSNKRAS